MRKLVGSDRVFYYTLLPFGGIVLAVFILLLGVLAWKSVPILVREGASFFTKNIWKPSETSPSMEEYGILAPLLDTLYTSLIALVLATPASLLLALLTAEYAPIRLRGVLENIVDLMAGVPTVVYGLWGAFVVAPMLREYVMKPLHEHLGFLPLFSCEPISGQSVLTAGVVLAVMITPFMTGVIREAYSMIPFSLREALASIGATRLEMIRVLLSMMKPAIMAAGLLGLGRAAGETIAVSLTIGNSFSLSPCMLRPGYTISSLIANQFPNAGFYYYMTSALYASGLTLLLMGVLLNLVGLKLMWSWRERIHG